MRASARPSAAAIGIWDEELAQEIVA